ncbi:glycosyltransferase [Pseudooceanicola aestuarii]|uniref:glycosyltransferase n=1 Tax=Pseudooceanicola aestuarii TaxID=2697319 RepID=UPI0013D27316|nr:glycosyltransferase [Pseudooceanicola aestuarii]
MTLVPRTFEDAEPAVRLKIVILNDSGTARGGATGLALRQARLMRARGHDVTFISGDSQCDPDLTAHGVATLSLGGALLLDDNRMRAMRNGLYNHAAARRLRAFIAMNDTPRTLYHLHGWSRILSPSVFDALRPVARRSFLHAHDFFLACPNGVYFDYGRNKVCTRTPLSGACMAARCDKRNMAQKGWRLLRQASLRRAFAPAAADGPDWAGVMMVHPAMAEGLTRAGIPAELLREARNPAAPYTDLRIRAEDNGTCCYIGQNIPGKGVAMLCEAARRAGVPLKVIGDPGARPELVRAYPEVRFTGWVEPDNIGDHLQDVRALVMPSRFTEPFGLVAAEASLSGLPVIVSDTAMLAGEVESAGLGLRADATDPDALARSLRRMVRMPAAQVRAISLRGYDRSAPLAQPEGAWIDAMLNHYRRTLLMQGAAVPA